MTVHSPEPTTTALSADARARLLRYAFMKLTRDLDSRFEALLLTGRVSKWYSEVGSEATTIPAGLALGAGDALCPLHRAQTPFPPTQPTPSPPAGSVRADATGNAFTYHRTTRPLSKASPPRPSK